MIFHQVLSIFATFILAYKGTTATPLPIPEQHDALTVGQSTDDQFISACPDDKPDIDAGLCYKNCAEGYHGEGPVCWKGIDSYGRGVGTVPQTVDNPIMVGAGQSD
jgi:hypothetical protein